MRGIGLGRAGTAALGRVLGGLELVLQLGELEVEGGALGLPFRGWRGVGGGLGVRLGDPAGVAAAKLC